jgi:tricorn protease
MNKTLYLYLICLIFSPWILSAQGFTGYYRFPALSGETIVFTAEGDLWTVSVAGGLARRLTTHPGEETHPHISPDGQTLAFSATYEGPTEVYTMPLSGGLPQRWTYEAETSTAEGWTPQGEIVYNTTHFATLPHLQSVQIDPRTKKRTRIPLSQASETSFDASGRTLYFVRPADHRNVTKRYTGGTARQIWKFTQGTAEAVKLTTDHDGESHHPMWWQGRIYFITDRDGTMNLWSMDENGGDLRQHTRHEDFDVRYATLAGGRIVYQRGADIWLYDIASGADRVVPIRLASDLDQLREKWVEDPSDYITSVELHPEGKQLAITARGRVFVVPVESGRRVQLSRKEGVRYRDAVFTPDGEQIIVLSDESGEFEFMRIGADGIGAHQALTDDGTILRYKGKPSPDGKWLAYDDLNQDLWLLNIATGEQKKISTNNDGIGDFTWSPDSRWLSFVQTAKNTFAQILLYRLGDGNLTELTTDRMNSMSPTWSPDGQWLYFLSDRNFETLVGSPWGTRQPEPYFDRQMKLYHVALQAGTRSPFHPDDELWNEPEEKKENGAEKVTVQIDTDGIARRIQEVPVSPGNYSSLRMNDKALYFTASETGAEGKTHLMVLAIDNDDPEPKTMVEDIRGFDLAANGKKIMVRKNGSSFYVVEAGTGAVKDLSEAKVDLSDWTFSLDPREDWRQLFTDAWRMERDYFYDPGMHGVDWDGMYQKYLPLVDRVTTRSELSDLIGRFVGELSALHTSVRGGDLREGPDDIDVASLGARFSRDEAAGGYRIDYIYRADPDYPDERSPLDQPGLDINVGDVLTHVNGDAVLSAPDLGALLRNQAGEQVRIGIKPGGTGDVRDRIVVPLRSGYALRYRDWEYSRRQIVEERGAGQIGYVHLQAMGSSDLERWYREFYPVFNRQGLIIDVRHNRGGNIESFILEKLLRQAWMYWKNRDQDPYWNMQYAFRGHMVVLVDERTASDGEAFADGFRRLGLGKVIGTRTWGGEIWLSSANRLSDNGLARAPMMGVYGPEGEWLIEQRGVEPDIVVDNLPHATFNGQDAQLDAAIQHLLELIEQDPREVPEPPPFPDRSFGKRKKK